MACIISPPFRSRKGVLSLTTSDIQQLEGESDLSKLLQGLRSRYLIGLHHNWHPVDFQLPVGFDFHFLESKDLIFPQNELLFELDACNFSPKIFEGPLGKSRWDILIVGRTANFKRPFKTLETIRELYDAGHALKVLWICPMENNLSMDSEAFNLLSVYESIFTSSEKERFTFLNPSANFPFTFSRDELALFYQSSRLYVHFADFETRCRTAAYAFVAGIPVVGRNTIANILPLELHSEPIFYEVKDDDYVAPILRALASESTTSESNCARILSEKYSIIKLVERLNSAFSPEPAFTVDDLWHNNLDVRLGASHLGKLSSNSYSSTLKTFCESCVQMLEIDDVVERLQLLQDPENELDRILLSNLTSEENPPTAELFVLNSYRKLEIKRSYRGNFRFRCYSTMKSISETPIFGSLFLKLWLMAKRLLNAKK
jgi:hypothetical protein